MSLNISQKKAKRIQTMWQRSNMKPLSTIAAFDKDTLEQRRKAHDAAGGKGIQFEYQELGKQLEPTYGKRIWSLFHKSGVTEDKVRRASEIAKRRGIETFAYLVGIIKKL